MRLSVLSSLDQENLLESGFESHLQSMTRIAQQADGLGYSTLFLFRNAMNPNNLVTDPLMLQSYIAASVRTLRLGVGIAPLSVMDPVILAERCATLDAVSGGRVTIAVDEGHLARDLKPISLERSQAASAYKDNYELFRTALRGERFSAEGTHRRATNLKISVRPVQAPHPPVHIAVYSPGTAREAGLRGFKMFFAPLAAAGSTTETAAIVKAFRDGQQEAGIEPAADDVIAFCLGHIQTDHARAIATGRDCFQRHALIRPHWLCRDFSAAIGESYILIGSPSAVREKMSRLSRIGIDHIALMPTFGSIPVESVLETMRLATEALRLANPRGQRVSA